MTKFKTHWRGFKSPSHGDTNKWSVNPVSYRYVVEKSEDQERNKPLDSRSAIQVRADAYFKKRRKVSYEAVKGNWH